MLKEVYALMEKLEEIFFFPNTRTYSILMVFHAQNDDIDEVLCHFKKMMGCQTVLHAFCIKYMISKFIIELVAVLKPNWLGRGPWLCVKV